jgi:hypothetical protein
MMLHNCCWNMVPKESETLAELKLLIRSTVFAGPSFVISSSRPTINISHPTTVEKISVKHSAR